MSGIEGFGRGGGLESIWQERLWDPSFNLQEKLVGAYVASSAQGGLPFFLECRYLGYFTKMCQP